MKVEGKKKACNLTWHQADGICKVMVKSFSWVCTLLYCTVIQKLFFL